MTVAYAVAASCAPIGLSFTAVALATGMLWGGPMWGTYWAWDPRLTSELLMLFLYLGCVGLRGAMDVYGAPIAQARCRRWSGWSTSDHSLLGDLVELAAPGSQCHEIRPTEHARLDAVPLLLMFAGFTCFFVALLLCVRAAKLLRRERNGTLDRRGIADEPGDGNGPRAGLLAARAEPAPGSTEGVSG